MRDEQRTGEPMKTDVSIRPLSESDLTAADHIMRLAFGTFIGVPNPAEFMGDVDHVRTRWLADPTAAFGAEIDGELVGSNFAVKWGSLGLFGPLTVHPDYWDRGIGTRLIEPVMAKFAEWEIKQAGLFTFSDSAKHVGLYQKFGFWPRFLTAVMSKPVQASGNAPQWSKYSEVPESEQENCLSACRELTDAIYQGLDLEREIRVVRTRKIGDTVFLSDDAGLAGFAVCHCGPGSEAGSGVCYVKFGAIRPGPNAGELFEQLLDACEALASEQGLSNLNASVNMARDGAYRQMLARGFRTVIQGVAMHRPNEPCYNRPDAYVIGDWR